MNPIGLFFVAGGAFSLLGATCDWDWFMNARKARLVVKLLSRTGARVFYGLLGLLLVVTGILGTLGMIDMSS